MSKIYKLSPSGGVIKLDEDYDVFIPFDLANPLFRVYGQWLLDGNVPDPAEYPPGYPGRAPEMPYTLVDIKLELDRLALPDTSLFDSEV